MHVHVQCGKSRHRKTNEKMENSILDDGDIHEIFFRLFGKRSVLY